MIVAVHFILVNVVDDKEGAEDNSARGYYKVGTERKDPALDRIEKLGDECSGMQGFVIFGWFDGGTGAGFGSLPPGLLSANLTRREARVDSLPGSSGRWSHR
jgi:tubulin alpha